MKWQLTLTIIFIFLDNLSEFNCTSDYDYNLRRFRRQEDEAEDETTRTLLCDFGSATTLQLCGWSTPLDGHANVRWRLGQGASAYWVGGPLIDHTSDENTGGYVYFETSYKAVTRVFTSSALQSSFQDISIPVSARDGDQILSTASSPNRTVGPPQERALFGTAATLALIQKIQTRATSTIQTPLSSPSGTVLTPSLLPQVFSQPLLSVSSISVDHNVYVPTSALLMSPNISETGPEGICINFFYATDGLSPEKLRILVRDTETGINQTLWETSVDTEGRWIKAEIAYTYQNIHHVILEGIAKDASEQDRSYRGYIAVDDIQFQPKDETQEHCHGHCTFEGGMCGWTNQEEGDDFDWQLARGTDNIFTGPSRDYYSFSREYPLGGYTYIDSSYPRRPGDKALLLSPSFEPTGENSPVCFKFATHMYGNGIGTLRVKLKPSEGGDDVQEKILWEMSGEAGNNWYLAQLPIASAAAFQIVFEGVVGSNNLGNIAIDSIAIEHGSCPITPQTASRRSGDCTFEENMCSWTNPLAHSKLDDFDWIRQFAFGDYGPKADHTKKNANGYFMSLNGDALRPQRGGTSAWIISPEFAARTPEMPKCMSFYYFMYQRLIEPGGPSLGGLRVHIRTTDEQHHIRLIPVWRLNNHQAMKWKMARVPLVIHKGNEKVPPDRGYQVVIEGVWGDARLGSIAIDDISFYDGQCATTPSQAVAVLGECSFDSHFCGWNNESRKVLAQDNEPLNQHKIPINALGQRIGTNAFTWRMASPNSRPANLQDHTFRAPIGYIFFDVFNQNSIKHPVLRSPKFPIIEGEVTQRCLSFWFAGFGRGESTTLRVVYVTEGDTGDADIGEDDGPAKKPPENKLPLWSITTKKFDTRRPVWHYGQVTMSGDQMHWIWFEGDASDGGFAVDDITFYEGPCETRPAHAAVVAKTEEDS